MRSSALVFGLCLAALPASTRADQLIQIPTADRVETVRAEYLHRAEGENQGYGTFLVRTGLAYELMFRYYNNFDDDSGVEGGGLFQLLPDGIVTPGIAVGLWDVTNSTPFGRRAFFVLTKSLRPGQLGVPEFLERVQLTLGTGTGRFSGLLAGLRVDLPSHFSLVGEFDARRFNAGLWFTPSETISLKAELQNGEPYIGGTLRVTF